MSTNQEQIDELSNWVEEHGDCLYRYALRQVGDQLMAEDLVQEVFLAAAKSRAEFRSESSVRTWLIGILRHKSFDLLRYKQRHKFVHLNEAVHDEHFEVFDEHEHFTPVAGPRDWAVSPESELERGQLRLVLMECLESLPENQRSMFISRELYDISREELAQEAGVSANNIGVILHRIRVQLRGCVQRKWLTQ